MAQGFGYSYRVSGFAGGFAAGTEIKKGTILQAAVTPAYELRRAVATTAAAQLPAGVVVSDAIVGPVVGGVTPDTTVTLATSGEIVPVICDGTVAIAAGDPIEISATAGVGQKSTAAAGRHCIGYARSALSGVTGFVQVFIAPFST